MIELTEYPDFQSKQRFFFNGTMKIDSFQRLENILNSSKIKNDGWVYRGINEAKYQILSSAQRYFIKNYKISLTESDYLVSNPDPLVSDYNNYVKNLIKESKEWNNQTVKKLLLANNINENNVVAYMSFMQHFGVPTPLIDFTYSFLVALYFAIDKIVYPDSKTTRIDDINHYFSVYLFQPNLPFFTVIKEYLSKKLKDSKEHLTYEDLFDCNAAFLNTDFECFNMYNNSNIINQEGLFVYSNQPICSFEYSYHAFIKRMREKYNKNKFGFNECAICFDIKKSLAPDIKQMLESRNITHEFLFPNFYDMKNSILKKIKL